MTAPQPPEPEPGSGPTSKPDEALRARILSDPHLILDDPGIIRVLVAACDADRGQNVVDLRGIALSQLEHRLTQLEGTHEEVLAAAYDNLASTNRIHRAVLTVLDAEDWSSFVALLDSEFRDVLNVAAVRLCLEFEAPGGDTSSDPALVFLSPNRTDDYITGGRPMPRRVVTLRRVQKGQRTVYGSAEPDIRSEAVIRLDLGRGKGPAMLALGSADSNQFAPSLKPDLLQFLGNVVERLVAKWMTA